MEFGLHERLPIYSGGLGVLAGDHLKAAAELGVPLVGVGLLYRGGYFRQGDRRRRAADRGLPAGRSGGGRRHPRARHGVGRPRRRDDRSRRLAQGSRLGHALPARGRLADRLALRRRPRAPDPAGAAARRRRRPRARGARDRADRVPPERGPLGVPADRAHPRRSSQQGLETADALEHVRARRSSRRTRPCRPATRCSTRSSSSATSGELAAEAGLDREALLELGRFGDKPGFGLTPLALRLSAYANGVSELHGEVAREMWERSGRARRRRSVTSRTASTSAPGSTPRLGELLALRGRQPGGAAGRGQLGRGAGDLDTAALWRVHAAAKARLAERAGIDRDRLTIGFARRFATYKRAGLVFSDLERLLALPAPDRRRRQGASRRRCPART